MTSHRCPTPDTGLPGDEWTCPTCGRKWWADEPDYSTLDALYIEWRED